MSVVVFFVLAAGFLFITRQHLNDQLRETGRTEAFYRAERGINAVVNLLMRDPDDDFRTAGEKKPPVFPDTVPYSFDFQNVNFQVVHLDEFNNPLSDEIFAQTGTPHLEDMFRTKKDSIWIKVTGFYYPRDEYSFEKARDNDQYFYDRTIARTMIVRLSKFPMDAFDFAFYTCHDIEAKGMVEVSGPIWVGGTTIVQPGANHFDYDENGSTLANSPDETNNCINYLGNIKAWANDLCAQPDTIQIPPGVLAGNNIYYGNTILCCEGDLKIAGTVRMFDTDVDGNYVGPCMFIVKGDLDITGTMEIHGLIMTFGDYIAGDETHVSGSAGSEGTVISLSKIWITGANGLELAFKDYGDFGYGRTISASKWRETWEKFFVERNGVTYTIEVEHLPIPVIENPVEY